VGNYLVLQRLGEEKPPDTSASDGHLERLIRSDIAPLHAHAAEPKGASCRREPRRHCEALSECRPLRAHRAAERSPSRHVNGGSEECIRTARANNKRD
jgi:hypothetical protein